MGLKDPPAGGLLINKTVLVMSFNHLFIHSKIIIRWRTLGLNLIRRGSVVCIEARVVN